MSGPILHGGRLAEVEQLFPDAPRPFIDLSTGINPHPYPMPVLDPADYARLPEPSAIADLEAAAAAAYGISDRAVVVAAAGSQAALAVLPRLRSHGAVAVLGPTYAEHAASWHACGHAVREVSSLTDDADVVVVCNPNNPDGRAIDAHDLVEVADSLASRGGWLVVDEAFIDLTGHPSVASSLPHPGLIVLRSFGKTYGLAGLRLGFALAASGFAARLRSALGPWPVSGPAIAVGRLALRDDAWLTAARRRAAKDATGLRAVLVGAGLDVSGQALLFHLAHVPNAPALHRHLCAHGILTRPFPAQPHWLRFGLPPSAEALARLRHALAVRPRNTWRED